MKLFSWIPSYSTGANVTNKPSSQQPSEEEPVDGLKGLLDRYLKPYTLDKQQINTPRSNMHKELISLFTKKETKLSDKDTRPSGLQILRSGGNDSNKVVIVKEKSVLFLLKKFFVCGISGFSSVPGRVRDPSSELTLGQIWRSILHKKIYPHWSCRESPSIPKKYIENGHELELDDEEIDGPEEASGSKWDRTDSEYIVLEI